MYSDSSCCIIDEKGQILVRIKARRMSTMDATNDQRVNFHLNNTAIKLLSTQPLLDCYVPELKYQDLKPFSFKLRNNEL